METPYKRFYLDFNSAYRNRVLWPEPGEFAINLAQSCPVNSISAVDPVSKATPLLSWTSNRFQQNAASSTTVSGTVLATGVGQSNSNDIIIFQTGANNLQQEYNYYIHSILQSTSPAAKSRIIEYKYLGNNTGQVKLNIPINLPAGTTVQITDPSSFADPNLGLLFVPGGGEGNDDYFGKIIYNETLKESRIITGYDNDTGLLTIGLPSIATWLTTHNYSIRPENPLFATVSGGASTRTNIIITGGSTVDNIYNGMFIRVVPVVYINNLTPPENEYRRIVAYDGTTNVATVFPPFSGPVLISNIELLQFSYDNANTFTYKGTLEGEPSIYAIRLLSLTLPNRILEGANGGKIAYYPYVYVELTPYNIPSNNLIMSNNPNAINMMFKASLNNIQNIQDAVFTHLKGDDMVQVFRFKVDTNFKVKVILPGGELFKIVEPEYFSPSAPNPIAQISMLFELYRG